MNHRELKSEVPKVGFDSGPLSGSPTCASFEQSVNYYLALRSYQVRCFLQWAKVIRARAAKEPLFIDFDETAMKFNYAKLMGLIISKKHLPPGKKHRKEQISASEAKASVSFLAFISADPSVQGKLPQVILGNKHKLTAALVAELAPPENFHIWREESGWVNKKMMTRALTLLAKYLKDVMLTRQDVLVMDTVSAHLAQSVFAYANRLNIIVMFVPAQLTPLLQPADTHLFGKLKRKLKQRWLQLRVQDENGKVPHKLWLAAVFEVCRDVMCTTSWQAAFASAGLLGEHVSDRVLKRAGWEALPPISAELPSCKQLASVFPRGKIILSRRASLFRFCCPVAKAKTKAKAKAKAKAKVMALSAEASTAAHALAPNVD